MTEGWTKEMMAAYCRAEKNRARMNDKSLGGFARAASRANVKRITRSILRMAGDAGVEVTSGARKELAALAQPEQWPPNKARGGW